jgi:hypothetical protein
MTKALVLTLPSQQLLLPLSQPNLALPLSLNQVQMFRYHGQLQVAMVILLLLMILKSYNLMVLPSQPLQVVMVLLKQ